jgi:hypothetical protein
MVTDMGELSHLDELEAEAIYIIREGSRRVREAGYVVLNWKGQLGNASSCNEGILSGEARHFRFYM